MDKKKKYSNFELAKGWRELRVSIIRFFKDLILITLGIFSAAFGFKGFLLTNHFIDGGATGISLLISALTDTPLAILLILVNIPFIILAYIVVGKSFAIKTSLAISGLALVVATVLFLI
ncbi:MAG: YitT family protein [Ignavibacteriales bacterium]|nr:YitT family protein [Ignavibacteriales bacterium]